MLLSLKFNEVEDKRNHKISIKQIFPCLLGLSVLFCFPCSKYVSILLLQSCIQTYHKNGASSSSSDDDDVSYSKFFLFVADCHAPVLLVQLAAWYRRCFEAQVTLSGETSVQRSSVEALLRLWRPMETAYFQGRKDSGGSQLDPEEDQPAGCCLPA